MENSLINLVHHEIDIIVQKQIMIVKLNEEVEDRRIRLMEFVQSDEDLQISSKARNDILENVSNMEMKVLCTTKVQKEAVHELSSNFGTTKTTNKEEVIDDSVEKKKKDVKCRYNNRGYCSQSGCVFLHSEKVCEKVLANVQT